jgi:hypothetical protein
MGFQADGLSLGGDCARAETMIENVPKHAIADHT